MRSRASRLWTTKKRLNLLLLVGLTVHVGWILYTAYINEDAFITFRFARNLAQGLGFTYNPPHRVYGTTTPLFTILMAIWHSIWPDPIYGALLFDLLATLGMIALTYLALEETGLSIAQRDVAMLILIFSSRLWYLNTMGMEMPWVLLFIAASWLAYKRERWRLTGILLGGLLWVRPDTLLWILVLGITALLKYRSKGMTMLLIAGATYLPWLVYAWIYFGSPIPMTITAKYWGHFVQGSSIPAPALEPPLSMLLTRIKPLGVMFWYTNPFGIRDSSHPWNSVITVFSTIALITSAIYSLKNHKLLELLALLVLELSRLLFFRQLFADRYFIAAIWASSLLIGSAIGSIWNQRKSNRVARAARVLASGIILGFVAITGTANAQDLRALQRYRNEASLKQIGGWLHENLPAHATVQLEPLGYIGYYSRLNMIDEVGLVTPDVVELKKHGITDSLEITRILAPDSFVIHCDDATRMVTNTIWLESQLQQNYHYTIRFNPLDFHTSSEIFPRDTRLARSSCYEIWLHTEHSMTSDDLP